MHLVKTCFFVLACALSLSATVAYAGVPAPPNSTLPACVTICPNGDMAIQVVVRDFANNPIAGSAVAVDFALCPSVAFCPPAANDGYVINGRMIVAFTGATGSVTIGIHAGGLCDASQARIFADGVLLGTRNVTSPDQDGSLFVTGVDQVLQFSGAATPGKDLDCDGSRTAADAGILAAHMGHTCSGVVGTQHRSWGTLKLLYR